MPDTVDLGAARALPVAEVSAPQIQDHAKIDSYTTSVDVARAWTDDRALT
ncbi:hypothetical protein [Nonomuraea sp. NPDC049758]